MTPIDTCIIIDPLYDFFSINGVYCTKFGIEDTVDVRKCMVPIQAMVHHITNAKKGMQLIIVKSKYSPNQFEEIPNLCCSSEGQTIEIIIENNQDSMLSCFVIEKATNNIFDCEDHQRAVLRLHTVDKNVFVCGVTTTSCVNTSVNALLPACKSVHVSKDCVASRHSNSSREQNIYHEWSHISKLNIYKNWHDCFV